MVRDGVVGGSFRDPSGVVFRKAGVIYRQVNGAALADLERLENSGLYQGLVEAGLLVAHEDVDVEPPDPTNARRVIRPEPVPFISYPYEWCFGQLKDAALATLDIQLAALEHDMSLKDASAFNIQFLRGKPVLLDTLSLETYTDGQPWTAYRQFCEHFVAPLLLMRDLDPWFGRLPQLTVDGVPLQIASKMLGWRSYLSPSTQLHIHQHARLIQKYGGRSVPKGISARGLSRKGLTDLIEGLHHFIEGSRWEPTGTEWADYETEHGYAPEDHAVKKNLVRQILEGIGPSSVWDLGANTGEFSRIARETGAWVLAADVDPAAVERNYRTVSESGETGILPLVVDLRNPAPATGWALRERDSLVERSNADTVLALALIHHLAIGGNVPLPLIAEWLAQLTTHLVVEFVPKDDPQVARLLVSRADVFDEYSASGFEEAFTAGFTCVARYRIGTSNRTLYHFRRRTE